MARFDPGDFEVLYPGVYGTRESGLMKERLASDRALRERGRIDQGLCLPETSRPIPRA